jgi:Novel STAND NTPase 1
MDSQKALRFGICGKNCIRQNELDCALEYRPEERRRVVDELRCAAESYSGNLLFVVRTDFLGTALEDPYVLRGIGSQSMAAVLFPLPPPTRDELRSAVLTPALQSGIQYETGLVDEIIDDLGPRPTNLAYLQTALWRLWNASRGKMSQMLTREDYCALGGIDGLLAPLRELESWKEQARPLFLAWEGGGRPTELLLSGPLLERGQRLMEGPLEHLLPIELREYLRQSRDAHTATLFSRQAFHQALKTLQFPGLARRLTDAEREFDEASRQLTEAEELSWRYTERLGCRKF